MLIDPKTALNFLENLKEIATQRNALESDLRKKEAEELKQLEELYVQTKNLLESINNTVIKDKILFVQFSNQPLFAEVFLEKRSCAVMTFYKGIICHGLEIDCRPTIRISATVVQWPFQHPSYSCFNFCDFQAIQNEVARVLYSWAQ
jgi:maltoporin